MLGIYEPAIQIGIIGTMREMAQVLIPNFPKVYDESFPSFAKYRKIYFQGNPKRNSIVLLKINQLPLNTK